MASDFNRVRYLQPKYSRKSYHMLMKTLENSFAVEISDIAQFRIHVINHYYKYGLRQTLDAFRVKRSTFYDWKILYERSGKRIISLVPHQTRPLHVRKMETDWRLVSFIREMRQEHGNIGKSMLKPFVDAYAKELGIPTLAESTIGKVIKRRHLTFEKKIYIQRQTNKFKKLNPTKSHTVQTDNGSEFLKSFHAYLEEQNIKHQFIYPRMPKINAFIERFNRTIQEEFILRNDEIYYDQTAFAKKLTDYLYWYNYKRPHASLQYMSPMTFIQTKSPKSA